MSGKKSTQKKIRPLGGSEQVRSELGERRLRRDLSGVPVETCTTCHDRGKRIGVSFQGLMETPYVSPYAADGGPQPGLHTKHYIAMQQDIHYQKGMTCQDCHTSTDIHGDGFIAAANLAAVSVECADCHSGATQTAPGQLNPYKLGLDLFRHAERRGLDVLRLRSINTDVSFVDEVLDEDFIARSALFVTDPARRGGGAKIGSRDAHEVKQALLRSLAWGGQPRIELIEVHDGAVRDMVLRHDHDGRDLKLDEAGEMLRTIEGLWKGPVHLLTKEGDEARRLTSDWGELRMRDDGTGKPRAPQAQAG